ncbi:MAG: PDZ domain-containing protein, partial [Pseudomonadota bacterium]|nr:PDZ domain-containing protein [Pseudomonadota bacterium]
IISAHKNNQVSESGHIKRPWMGLAAQDVTAGIAEGLGLDRPSGALITEIHDASPARAAGLERGDLVVAVNGKKIRDASELRFRIATTPIDDHVRMTVSRKGKEKEIKFKSIAPPEIPARDTVTIDDNSYFDGFSFSNINPALREELGNDIPEKGVVISAINQNAQASRFIRTGDVVEEINGVKIETPKDVLKGLKTNFKGYRLAMTLNRNGQRQQIALR